MNLQPFFLRLLVLGAFAGTVLAAPAPQNKGLTGDEPRDLLKKELGLSDDQLKKIDLIKLQTEKSIEKNRFEIKNEELALKEESLNNTLTRARLKESLKKINGNMADIHNAFFQSALSVADILTDDQIKKMGEKKLLHRFLRIGGERRGMGPHNENDHGKDPMQKPMGSMKHDN